MAEIRTLKLNLLADVDQFGRGIRQAETDVTGLGGTVGKVSKAMSRAFALAAAAAGAYAIKLGVDSVKAAVEDEQSQINLAKALQNATKATDAQIKANEEYIRTQQLAFGVSDTQLRPAVANLARATGDLTKAQQLTNLALDISAATGKDVESVSLALGKAYNGNVGALTRLGVPLDENIKKSKDFTEIQTKLTELFGGAAQTNAQTYAGQLAILSQNVGEFKESLGVQLLPILNRLVEFANQKVIPTLQQVADGFSGKSGTEGLTGTALKVAKAMGYDENTPGENLGRALRNVVDAFSTLIKTLTSSETSDGISTLDRMANSLNTIANAITAVGKAYDTYKNSPVGKLFGTNFAGALTTPGLQLGGQRAVGGSVKAGNAYTVGEFGREVFVPSSNGRIVPNSQVGSNVTINLNGIVDAESARRSIEKLLQNSGARTGAVSLTRLAL